MEGSLLGARNLGFGLKLIVGGSPHIRTPKECNSWQVRAFTTSIRHCPALASLGRLHLAGKRLKLVVGRVMLSTPTLTNTYARNYQQ
jgi:hypothetical protein